MDSTKGKVQTVLGLIDPGKLGVTLMHEHIFIDITRFLTPPKNPRYQELAHQKITIENLGWVRVDPDASLDNLLLGDEAMMVREVLEYKGSGGDTIVDLTPQDIGRDPLGLQRVARLAGLNVVCGTAHYQGAAHPEDMSARSIRDVEREFVKEISEGIGETGIRPGIIGEVASSIPWGENERKCLAAAARAQKETGAPISIHPAHTRDSPFEIRKFLAKEGADIERVVIGHTDTRLPEAKDFVRLAELGCYVELDTFGLDRLQFGVSDKWRIEVVLQMIKEGQLDRILIAHDVCVKSQLKSFGGHGYDYILGNILPALRREGVTEKEIQQIMVGNPAEILTFA